MFAKHSIVCIVLLLTLQEEALAFNARAHKIAAEVAWQKLQPIERQAIVAILRKHPRFDEDFKGEMPQQVINEGTAAEDHWVFLQAAIWPDIARGIPQPDRGKYHRARWHYINLPVFLSDEQADAFAGNLTANVEMTLPSGPADDDDSFNGVQAVKNSLRVVNNPTASDKKKAVHYCWLLHLVPDLAQPLHAAAVFTVDLFPAGDKGGNAIKILRHGTSGEGQSLHSVWDGLLGKNSNFNDVLGGAQQLIADNSAEFNAPFVAMPNDVWSTESQALAIQSAYGPILDDIREAEENGVRLNAIEVPASYFSDSGKVAGKQAVTAGVRLAGVLASTLPASGGTTPFAVSRQGLKFPAVIAGTKAPRSDRIMTAERESAGRDQSHDLEQRVLQLEEEVKRLRTMLGNKETRAIEPRDGRRTLAERAIAIAAQDDGEQCDCGDEQ